MRRIAWVLGLVGAVLAACTGESGELFTSAASSSASSASSSSSSSATGTGASTSSSSSSGATGGGGTGGASNSSSSSGGACSEAADCAGYPGTFCSPVACAGGMCTTFPVNAGTPAADSTPGDCHSEVCDGAGGVVYLLDPSDVPGNGNECTPGTCGPQGQPAVTLAPKGTPCSQNGGTMCDGGGTCVQCVADDDCPQPPSCFSFFDQASCMMHPGCSWDPNWWECTGTAVGGSCVSGACM